MASKKIKIKRVYEKPQPTDGTRILVDRLWPRGVSKEKAKIDLWLKDVAPSHALRKWFNHDPKKWAMFKARYKKELKSKGAWRSRFKKESGRGPITLVYSARDEKHNQAVALQALL